jgi:hypothetical protein
MKTRRTLAQVSLHAQGLSPRQRTESETFDGGFGNMCAHLLIFSYAAVGCSHPHEARHLKMMWRLFDRSATINQPGRSQSPLRPRRARLQPRSLSQDDPVHQLLIRLTLELHSMNSTGPGNLKLKHNGVDPISAVEYVTDDYVQPEMGDDHVNVNCVLSWRHSDAGVHINFRNSWVFDSSTWRGSGSHSRSVLPALRRNLAGKIGSTLRQKPRGLVASDCGRDAGAIHEDALTARRRSTGRLST